MAECSRDFFKHHNGESWLLNKEKWGDWVVRNYKEPMPALSSTRSVWDRGEE